MISEVSADRLPSELGSDPASDVPAGGTSVSDATRAMPVLWFVEHVTPDQRQNDTGAEAATGHANVFDLRKAGLVYYHSIVKHEKAAPMLEFKARRITMCFLRRWRRIDRATRADRQCRL